MADTGNTEPTVRTSGDATPIIIAAVFVLLWAAGLWLVWWLQRPPVATDDYFRAAVESFHPENRNLPRSLACLKPQQEVTVVTWTKNVASYQNTTAPKDTWVTIVPDLQQFCRQYMRSHTADQLALRLKQRLGLPASASYTSFVELKVTPQDIDDAAVLNSLKKVKDVGLFRPCLNPSVKVADCAPPFTPPANRRPPFEGELWDYQSRSESDIPRMIRIWLMGHYYWSFAQTPQYPWTSLGYTFDWAKKEDSDELVKFGESEFVIPADAPIKFVSATDTLTYCTPK